MCSTCTTTTAATLTAGELEKDHRDLAHLRLGATQQGRHRIFPISGDVVMLNYKKNGLNASIKFYAGRVPAKAKLFAFRCAKENMEDLYDDSGYGWDDEDKRRELGEKACRFLVAYDEVRVAHVAEELAEM